MRRSWLLALLTLLPAGRAAAQDAAVCSPSLNMGPVEVTPASEASFVPQNAVIKVRYSTDYFAPMPPNPVPSELITLSDANDVPVAGTLETVPPDILYFVPSATLAANTKYHGTATGLDTTLDFTFTTGTTADVAAPSLPQPSSSAVQITSSSVDPSCDAPSGGRRVGITFQSATDDGPATSIEYLLFLTRGPGVSAPTLLTRDRGFTSDTTTLGFVLPPSQLASSVCVTLIAVDGLDQAAAWREPACFDPVSGLHFEGLCSAAPVSRGRTPMPALSWMAAVAAVLAVRRLRRRERAN